MATPYNFHVNTHHHPCSLLPPPRSSSSSMGESSPSASYELLRRWRTKGCISIPLRPLRQPPRSPLCPSNRHCRSWNPHRSPHSSTVWPRWTHSRCWWSCARRDAAPDLAPVDAPVICTTHDLPGRTGNSASRTDAWIPRAGTSPIAHGPPPTVPSQFVSQPGGVP